MATIYNMYARRHAGYNFHPNFFPHGLPLATASYRAKLTHNGAVLTNVSQTQTFVESSHNAAISSWQLVCCCESRTLQIIGELIRTFSKTKYFEKKCCDQI
jgi:hypothetical protein